jgi:hypothetical protein
LLVRDAAAGGGLVERSAVATSRKDRSSLPGVHTFSSRAGLDRAHQAVLIEIGARSEREAQRARHRATEAMRTQN